MAIFKHLLLQKYGRVGGGGGGVSTLRGGGAGVGLFGLLGGHMIIRC